MINIEHTFCPNGATFFSALTNIIHCKCSDLVKLMAAIIGNDLCPDWWPTSADQVERLLQFPEFKSQTYDIHHFCPVCGRRFSNLLAPSEYGQSPLQRCSNPGCEGKGKRFRREGSALVPTQVAYYKKPARIFEKLARSREVMEVLAKERERREEKMKTLYEWEDWFDGESQFISQDKFAAM